MNTISQLIIGFIAFVHLYILWLEMFAWTTQRQKSIQNHTRRPV